MPDNLSVTSRKLHVSRTLAVKSCNILGEDQTPVSFPPSVQLTFPGTCAEIENILKCSPSFTYSTVCEREVYEIFIGHRRKCELVRCLRRKWCIAIGGMVLWTSNCWEQTLSWASTVMRGRAEVSMGDSGRDGILRDRCGGGEVVLHIFTAGERKRQKPRGE